MPEIKDSVSPAEKNLLRTLQQIETRGVTTFKPFNLSRIKDTWGENYATAFRTIPKLVASDPNPAELVLIDTTSRPKSLDEEKVYPDDPFSEIIEKLRREGRLRTSNRVPLGSRLDLSYNKIQQCVLPNIAELLGVDRSQVRLPKIIEYALLIPIYPEFRQKSDVWEWFEDQIKGWWIFASSRLTVHFSDGTMHDLPWLKSPALQKDNLGFRPVIVF